MTQTRPTEPTLRELMTPVPHAVTAASSVADARSRMRSLGIRHLPVMHEGRVLGVLGERALAALCEHGRADSDALAAGDVLDGEDCVVVGPDTPVAAVLQSMLDRRADCAAVVERGELTGILTAHDLMRLLSEVLFAGVPRPSQPPKPSEVRSRILAEHAVLRVLYGRVEDHALAVLEDDAADAGPLREHCHELCTTLLRHIELENAVLAPALHDLDAFGPIRAKQLLTEHERQRLALEATRTSIDERRDRQLAGDIIGLLVELRSDMTYEEGALLDPNLLRDDPVAPDTEAG